jgi:chondroitin 4-sulfotransferase 11
MFYKLFLKGFLIKVGHFLMFSLKIIIANVFNVSIYPPEYFVVKSKKLVYIVNSKAACSSIKRALIESDFSEELEVNHYSDIHKASLKFGYTKNKMSKNEMEYYVFTFVRNPFKRIVSLYVNKFEDREKIVESGYFQYKNYMGGIIDQNITFNSFVKIVSNIPDKFSERHFISQSFYLDRSPKKLDFIGKLENFHEDYGVICKTFGIENNITNSNRSLNYDYKDYFNIETLDLVYRRYKNDVIGFGYENEYKELKKYIIQRDEKI